MLQPFGLQNNKLLLPLKYDSHSLFPELAEAPPCAIKGNREIVYRGSNFWCGNIATPRTAHPPRPQPFKLAFRRARKFVVRKSVFALPRSLARVVSRG